MNDQVSAIQRAACALVVKLEALGITVRIVSLTSLVHIATFAPTDFMDLLKATRTANVSTCCTHYRTECGIKLNIICLYAY